MDRFGQLIVFETIFILPTKCMYYFYYRTCKNLKDLILLYATFTGARWREPPVMEWLIRNANELADRYDVDSSIKVRHL